MAEWTAIPIQENQQLLLAKICHPWTWRIANMLMAVFFSLAAYVQVSVEFVYKTKRRILPLLYKLNRYESVS